VAAVRADSAAGRLAAGDVGMDHIEQYLYTQARTPELLCAAAHRSAHRTSRHAPELCCSLNVVQLQCRDYEPL